MVEEDTSEKRTGISGAVDQNMEDSKTEQECTAKSAAINDAAAGSALAQSVLHETSVQKSEKIIVSGLSLDPENS